MPNLLGTKGTGRRPVHPYLWDAGECEAENRCVRLPWWVLIYAAAIGVILLLASASTVYPP